MFDTVYNTDPEGNAEITRRMAEEIKGKNPNLRFATPDLFFHGNGSFWQICEKEADQALQTPITR